MRIAVTAESDEGLAASVAQHFGHAAYFVLIEVDAGEVGGLDCLANPFAEGHRPGQIPQFISEKGAEVMLSGGMGGRAIEFFQQYGIATATGARGTVGEAVADYLDGRLLGAAPCANSASHGHG
jgi:predicted Fe-Mo cluster-binding NifX family protein